MDLVKIRMQFRKCMLHVYAYNISGVVSVLKFVNFFNFSIIKLFWQHIFNQSLKKLPYIKYRFFWIRCSELKVIKMLFSSVKLDKKNSPLFLKILIIS